MIKSDRSSLTLLANKVKKLTQYISRQDSEVRISDNESSDSDEESNSEDDLVVARYSSAESSESETNEEPDLVPVVQLPRQIRSARNIGISYSRYRDCFLY